MKKEKCKNCMCLEIHDEEFYCGDVGVISDEAKVENIDECEWAEELMTMDKAMQILANESEIANNAQDYNLAEAIDFVLENFVSLENEKKRILNEVEKVQKAVLFTAQMQIGYNQAIIEITKIINGGTYSE